MKSIIAAISLAHQENRDYTESTGKLLNMAPVLARKLKADLTFVNVFEPTQAPPWGEIPIPDKILLSRSDLDQALRLGKEYALKKYRDETASPIKQHGDEEVKNLCEQELHRRSQDSVSFFKNKVEYNAQAIFGEVDTGIERIIDEKRPNFIVFGRHRMLKVRPLMVGRMTSRALLDLKHPVIVVLQ